MAAEGAIGRTGSLAPFIARVSTDPGLPLAAAAALFFAPVLTGGVFFQSDFHLVFEPLRHVLGASYRNGPPLWTTAIGNGAPLLASPFVSALYPPNLAFGIPGIPAARVLSLLTVLHVLWGAAGQLLWLRALGLGAVASFAGAVVFALCGTTASSLHLVVLIWTAAWIPWLLLAHRRLMAARPGAPALRAALGVASVTLAMLLSGDPVMMLAGFLGAGIDSVRATRGGDAPAARSLARTAGALLLAFLAAAPLLAAWARLLPETVRALGFSSEGATYWSLHPAELLEVVLPSPFGEPLVGRGPAGSLARGLHAGFLPVIPGRYAGILACCLAIYGALRARLVAIATWLAALVVLALGDHTPLYPLLLQLPPLRALRYPMKLLVAAAVPFGALTAAGLEMVSRDLAAGARRRFALAAAALPAAAALAVGLASGVLSPWLARGMALEQRWGRGAPTGTAAAIAPVIEGRLPSAAGRALAPVAVAALASFWLARRGRSRLVPHVLAGIVTVDLLLRNRALAPTTALAGYERVPAVVRAIRADGGGAGRVWVDASPSTRSAPVSGSPFLGARERLDAYTGASWDLAIAFPLDVEALSPLGYAQLRQLVETLPSRERDRLLSSAGVQYVVSVPEMTGPEWRLVAQPEIGPARPIRVYRNLDALPRFRMVRSVLAHDGVEGFVAALRGADREDFRRSVAVDGFYLKGLLGVPPPRGGYRLVGPGRGEPPGGWTLRLLEDTGGRLAIHVSGPEGFLVVSDTLVTGWRAYVDGREAPLLPANLAFRAVPVPGGEHRVEMRYNPFW